MIHFANERYDIEKKFTSIVLWLSDGFTGERLIEEPRITLKSDANGVLEPVKAKCIRNKSGYYVFTDLDSGKYAVEIKSRFYSDEVLSNLDYYSAMPVVTRAVKIDLNLIPSPHYPFPSGTTLLRGCIKSDGTVLCGADLEALVLPPNSFTAKVLSVGAQNFVEMGFQPSEPRAFADGNIITAEGMDFEVVKSEKRDNQNKQMIKLKDPLPASLAGKDCNLLAVYGFKSRSTKIGEIAICFKRDISARYNARIRLKDKPGAFDEVVIDEGAVVSKELNV